MALFDLFNIPENPKLKFGVPLSEVCRNGVFHAGLKDLFLKAYLSAKGGDLVDSDNKSNDAKTSPVLLALRSGSKGQGSVAERMSLQAKLEAGEWLLAAQTSTGAPLWVLRHFLSRLPQPLLEGAHWKTLAESCGPEDLSNPENFFARIYTSIQALSRPEYEVLALIALLIRSLALKNENKDREELCEDTLNTLSEYFIASLMKRPFRPGLYTKFDKNCQPLLVFLSKYWSSIFEESCTSSISSVRSVNKKARESKSEELHSYFQNEYFDSSRDQIHKHYNKFIGFESLMARRKGEPSTHTSDNDSEYQSLSKNLADDLDVFYNALSINETELDVTNLYAKLEDKSSISETMINKTSTPNSVSVKDENRKNDIKEEFFSLKRTKSTSSVTYSQKEPSCNILYKRNSELSGESKQILPKGYFINNIEEDSISQSNKSKNIFTSSSSESDFFSIQNSDTSDILL